VEAFMSSSSDRLKSRDNRLPVLESIFSGRILTKAETGLRGVIACLLCAVESEIIISEMNSHCKRKDLLKN
jgi:hypothetical protein